MGIRERKQREYQKRKTLILDAASELFNSKGFSNVTLDDLADRIEFSKGTIYSHFGSKEEIYAHLLLEQLQKLHDRLKEALPQSTSLEDGIRRFLDAYLAFYNRHREYLQLLFFIDTISSRYRIPVSLLKDIHQRRESCLDQLQQLVRVHTEDDSAAHHRNAGRIAKVLWGMVNGIMQLAGSRQVKKNELESLIDEGLRIVVRGLQNLPENKRRN